MAPRKRSSKALNNEYKAFLEAQTHIKKITSESWKSRIRLWPKPASLNAGFFRKRLKSVSPATSKNEIWLAGAFFKWKIGIVKSKLRKTPKSTKLLKEKEHLELRLEELSAVKVPKGEDSVTIEDLYTHEELSKILNATHHTRDRALVEVLYESAFRAAELLSMTFKGVAFQEDGTALVTTTGKTGTRQIPIFRSVPALKVWMNVHPTGEGAIWTSLRHKSDKSLFNALEYPGMYVAVRRIIKRAKLGRKTRRIIHMFRHTRATELVRMGVRGQALNKFMGWTKRSNMESVYVHLSPDDVTNEIKSKVFGIDPSEEEKPEPLLKSQICPKCETHNEQGARFCVECNMPLSNDALVDLMERQEQQASLAKQVVALQELVKNIWETTMAPSTGKVIEFKDGKVKFTREDEGGGPVLPDEE
jgi:integrase